MNDDRSGELDYERGVTGILYYYPNFGFYWTLVIFQTVREKIACFETKLG
jgi:hypothetical protein